MKLLIKISFYESWLMQEKDTVIPIFKKFHTVFTFSFIPHPPYTQQQSYQLPVYARPWITLLIIQWIPLTPMGVLAHRLRTLDSSLVPPLTWEKNFRHMCRTTSENIPLSLPNLGCGMLLIWLLRASCQVSEH